MRSCMPVPALLPIGSASRQPSENSSSPDRLPGFLRARPDINIQMSMGNTEELLGGLRDGSCHFALVEGYFPEEEFACRVYSTEDFIPVCSASHTFSRPPERMSDLLCETLILREPGSGTRDILERALKLHNIPLSSFSVSRSSTVCTPSYSFCWKTAAFPFCIKPPSCLIFAKEGCSRSHCWTSACSTTFLFSGKKAGVFSAEYEEIFTHLREDG